MTAWKWTAPRAWYSATLQNDTRTTRSSPLREMPESWARARLAYSVVRRHSSGASAFHSTCAW
jgi:hypothetical protein